jgi:hypothetical protein
MGVWSRLKSIAGGSRTVVTLTSANGMRIPSGSNLFALSGSATVATMHADTATTNREVWFYQTSGTTEFTNSAETTTPGYIEAGTADAISLGASDVVCFILRPNGTWLQRVLTDN